MRFGLTVLAGITLAALPQTPVTTPRELVKAMRARYEGKWYRNVTFVQYNTATRPDNSVERTVWREWLQAPGRLRIEFEPADSGAGMIFAGDSHYVFRHDSTIVARPFIHPLLVLGFDVYVAPVETTVSQLAGRGFDMTVLSEGTWEGRPAWVVGAKAGDLRTAQFWVDKERLVFVRLIQPAGQGGADTAETRFSKYEPLAGGWVAPEVEFLVNGRRVFFEEYKEIRANVDIPVALWDPRQWKDARRLSRRRGA